MVQKITPTKAKQGTTQKANYRVLITSMVLALFAAVAVYGYFYSQTPQ